MTQMSVPDIKNSLDRVIHALQGRYTMGQAPASLMIAYFDWLIHMLNSPGKMSEMLENAITKGIAYHLWLAKNATADEEGGYFIEPLKQDHRFDAPEWRQQPFHQMMQGFLMFEQWWHYATSGIAGVNRHHQDMVSFGARQILDLFSPSNYPWSNPEVIKATIEQNGGNLFKGFQNYYEDLQKSANGESMVHDSDYKVGDNIACTQGKVVAQTSLMELIQYEPQTKTVFAEPILITPAWIMKYYILDLSPDNSLVRYLVTKGHTVFMISWKNPGQEERNMGMDDYQRLGIMAALDAINAIVPNKKVHTVGYCLGGTLLSIAAATMAREGDQRLASVSLLAAQTDFSEAGELMLFIDESQLAFMEDVMWDKGFLDTAQMAGAFQLLRSNDLIWSRMVHEYLLGQRTKLNDLMTWNQDTTRMPYKMHSEYLRRMFLNNELFNGNYLIDNHPIAISDIRAPIFMVTTTKDHVAPWKSCYKFHLPADTQITFVLSSGGHNAGIVSEPGHRNRSYQIATTERDEDQYVSPEVWAEKTPHIEGSWWESWQAWLAKRSTTRRVAPPTLGNTEQGYPALGKAPGTYVLEA